MNIGKDKEELHNLGKVINLVSSFGKKGVYTTRYYADIMTITRARIDELNKRGAA